MYSLSGTSMQEKCAGLMSSFGLRALILTCGASGSYVFSSGCTSYIKTPEVDVADTVGAGDSFTAAFTAGMLSGLDLGQAHQLAVETSAFVCTQEGAMPELPERLIRMCRK